MIRPMTWKPWTFFAVALAGWMNRQQQGLLACCRRFFDVSSRDGGYILAGSHSIRIDAPPESTVVMVEERLP
jgi:hypothetical protein